METETVTLPKGLLQAVHDYLNKRPMGKVRGLVLGLEQARPYVAPKEAE